MYYRGYHTTSGQAFTRDKHTVNQRFRVWTVGPVNMKSRLFAASWGRKAWHKR
jgi:hypothetical protein